MAKDKVSKMVSNLSNAVIKAGEMLSRFFDFIVAKIESLNPANNTKHRIVSSIILVPLAVYAIYVSKNLFIFLAIAIAILMTIEWLDMTRNMKDEKKWRVIGFFYILIPLYAVIRLRMIDENIVFWMFAIIWTTDIFAFFAGRSIGGPKLAPQISPNKTWSGMAGGVLASAIIGFISCFMFTGSAVFFILASVFLSLIEQASDLMESKFKRIFGVKDSGKMIPGHGGIIDRLDGMMLVAPVLLLVVSVFHSQFGIR